MVWLLIDRGTSSFIQALNGGEPLRSAMEEGRVAIVRLLVEIGAGVSAVDNLGGVDIALCGKKA